MMSVPAHAPFDYQALIDYQKQNSAINIKPIAIIKTEGLGEIPAKEIVEKLGITNQEDPKLDEATNEVYSKEFYSGILRENTGKFAGLKVSEVKDTIKTWLSELKNSDILLELNDGPIRCRCGAECVVKLLNNQWFLNYLDKDWKNKTNQCFEIGRAHV